MSGILLKNVVLDKQIRDVRISENKFSEIGENLIPQPGEELFDGGGTLGIFPAFYNNHTHAAMTLFRGYADDLEKISLKELNLGDPSVPFLLCHSRYNMDILKKYVASTYSLPHGSPTGIHWCSRSRLLAMHEFPWSGAEVSIPIQCVFISTQY